MDCSPPGSSVHRDCTGKNAGVGCHTLRQGIFPDPGIEPVSCRAGRFFTTEPFGKPQCYVRTGGKSKTSGDRRQIFFPFVRCWGWESANWLYTSLVKHQPGRGEQRSHSSGEYPSLSSLRVGRGCWDRGDPQEEPRQPFPFLRALRPARLWCPPSGVTGNPPILKAFIHFLKLAVAVGVDEQRYLGSRQSFLSIGTDYILWSWHIWISKCTEHILGESTHNAHIWPRTPCMLVHAC